MIINTTYDNYIVIKLNQINIDIFNITEVEDFTKEIITKVLKKFKLRGLIKIDIFIDKLNNMIITIKSNKYKRNSFIEAKLTFHLDHTFLYLIDYFDIKKMTNITKQNIYYYNNNFYLELISNISNKDYLLLSELGNIIIEDTKKIIKNGIKIKI